MSLSNRLGYVRSILNGWEWKICQVCGSGFSRGEHLITRPEDQLGSLEIVQTSVCSKKCKLSYEAI